MGGKGRELPVGGRGPEPRRSLADINECRRYPGRLCGHKCENTPGSYFCSCTVGFRLLADGRSCEGEAGAGGPRPLPPQPPASWGGRRRSHRPRVGLTHIRFRAHFKCSVSKTDAHEMLFVGEDRSP